ncbi:MAG: ABC transporter ATP-binding protein [Proteobacteria bacterium]|nr:ABC transporter ATP-binding protein [Pseudomonadota bacterium]
MNDIPTSPPTPLLNCCALDKSFADGERTLEIFRGLDLSIARAENVAIIGRSGSGKTTLLHMIAGLESHDNGQIVFDDRDLSRFSRADHDQYRLHSIGLVFQFHFLLPDFTACENIAIPALTAGHSRSAAMQAARQALDDVGLSARASHLPSALSGGERQRVAIARALINQPRLIIADEPTGNLDSTTAATVVDLLQRQAAASGSSLLIATHDTSIASRMDACYELTIDGLRQL